MGKIRLYLVITCLLWGLTYQGVTQVPDFANLGAYPTRHFVEADYGGHQQNFCAIQDDRGLIYIGNYSSLLVHDGVGFRRYTTPGRTAIKSLAKDDQGRVFYAGDRGFGYISSDSIGQLVFMPLVDRLPDQVKDVREFKRLAISSEGVFVSTGSYLLQIERDKDATGAFPYSTIKFWKPQGEFGLVFVFKNETYVEDTGHGWMKWEAGALVPVAVDDGITLENISALIPLKEPGSQEVDKALIATQEGQVFEFDGKKITQFGLDQEASLLLHQSWITGGIQLPNQHIALVVKFKGLLVLNQQGELIRLLDKSAGLSGLSINGIYPDGQGGLWLSRSTGLTRLLYPFPLAYFSEDVGVNGIMYGMVKRPDHLYISTDRGIFISRSSPSATGELFEKIPELNSHSFSILSTGSSVLASVARTGVIEIKGKDYRVISPAKPTKLPVDILASRFSNQLYFVGYNEWANLLYKRGNKWQIIHLKNGTKDQIRSMAEEAPGLLWMATLKGVFIRVEIPELADTNFIHLHPELDTLTPNVKRFELDKSSSGNGSSLYEINGRVMFCTHKGLKRFDKEKEEFVPDSSFYPGLYNNPVTNFALGANGIIWSRNTLSYNSYGYFAPNKPGSYTFEPAHFMSVVGHVQKRRMIPESPESQGLWLLGSNGFHYGAPADLHHQPHKYSAWVRTVYANGDSLIFAGADGGNPKVPEVPAVKFAQNSFRFEYAAPSFDKFEKNVFQVFLEGFDKKWSDWTTETKKDYTNVPEGKYVFRVKAKNIYQEISEEGTYTVQVLPPWYRTWWAYLGYLTLLGGAIFLYTRWRERRLRVKNLELEAIIAERTQELAQKNEQLLEMDQVKTRFFTNISHEFRTPMTVILGMIDQIEQYPEKWIKKGSTIVRRNSLQVLNLINQILDLRKLEFGSMKMEWIHGDIIQYIRYIYESFHSLAEDKDLQYKFHTEVEELFMDYDKDKVLSIVSNLLSNAIKYTPEGGRVSLNVRKSESLIVDKKTELSDHQTLRHSDLLIEVSDSGLGIPPEKLPHIFDRFYQVDDSSTRVGSGTGVGLALVKELVKLMEGNIAVESEVGKGSTFTVELPVRQSVSEISDAELPIIPTAKVDKEEIKPASNGEELPTLLIVEDNKDVVQYLVGCLEEQYRLLITYNGQEGIDRALETVPDLILCDVCESQGRNMDYQ